MAQFCWWREMDLAAYTHTSIHPTDQWHRKFLHIVYLGLEPTSGGSPSGGKHFPSCSSPAHDPSPQQTPLALDTGVE